jgi:hypothetical protein
MQQGQFPSFKPTGPDFLERISESKKLTALNQAIKQANHQLLFPEIQDIDIKTIQPRVDALPDLPKYILLLASISPRTSPTLIRQFMEQDLADGKIPEVLSTDEIEQALRGLASRAYIYTTEAKYELVEEDGVFDAKLINRPLEEGLYQVPPKIRMVINKVYLEA